MSLEKFSILNLEPLPPPSSAGSDLRPTSEGAPIRLGIVKVERRWITPEGKRSIRRSRDLP